MKIYLIRHGETDWNAQGRIQGREDIPLNAVGRAQAMRCGVALQGQGIERVVTSPLQRALETGQWIAEAVGHVPVTVDTGLIEREFGSWSGKIFADIYHPDVPVVGAEPLEEVGARMLAVLQRLAAGPEQAVAAVSHGGAINALLLLLSGGTFGSGITRLKNSCISVVSAANGKFAVQVYNLSPEEFEGQFPRPERL